jgi:hypothetical protein
MPFHTIEQGETLLALAAAGGLKSWEDIVNAPENASIKDQLSDPGILLPGLNVFIPNRVMRQEASAIDAKHPFTITRPKAWLRLAVKDAAGKPIAGTYTLTVDGVATRGTIPADGVIEQAVGVDASEGTLVVNAGDGTTETWDLRIGYMNPLDDDDGIAARLANLGFGDDPAIAIPAFQARVGLEPTGTVDDALRQKLKAYYDPTQDETTQESTS